MQQLQPLKSSSGPLGLAPGGGRDRDRHQPCCRIRLETDPELMAEHRLLRDKGDPGSLPHAALRARRICGAQSHPRPAPGDAVATTLPLQQVTDPPAHVREAPAPTHPLSHPHQTRGVNVVSLLVQHSPGALGLVGREVGSCHSLTPALP